MAREHRAKTFKLSERNFTEAELTRKYKNIQRINAPIQILDLYGPGSSNLIYEEIPLEQEIPLKQSDDEQENQDEGEDDDLFENDEVNLLLFPSHIKQ